MRNPTGLTHIKNCARCGNEHVKLPIYQFTQPVSETFRHYSICPNLEEPILVEVIEVSAAT